MKLRRRKRPNYANIKRLEQELGIGWLRWPGVGWIRDTCSFETREGEVIPIREAERRGLLA